MIRFRTLGGIDLRDAQDTELRGVLAQPKRLALLAYLSLASTNGPRRRDTIVGLFWPELDENRARAALNSAVHFLRQALGSETIVSRSAEELAIDKAHLWCDAAAFDAAVSAGNSAAAMELYQGAFLPGLFLENAQAFDGWLEHERSRMRTVAARVARSLAEQCERKGSVTSAVNYARQATQLSDMDERAVRDLLELLGRLGDLAGALHAYQTFADRLASEYGAEPAAQTQAVIARLRANAKLANAAADVAADAPPPANADARLAGQAAPEVSQPVAFPLATAAATPIGATPARSTPSRRARGVAYAGLAVGMATLLASLALTFRGRDEQWVRETAIPNIQLLFRDGKIEDAHALAARAAAILPGDSALTAIWSQFSGLRVFSTSPAGAQVYRAPFHDTSHWESLGTTPTDSVRYPLARLMVPPSLFRLEKPGYRTRYVPLEAIRNATPVLDSVAAPDPEMVRVSGGDFLPPMWALGRVEPVRLGDFLMDRFEVSNREFQAFVDAGGYTRAELWEPEFLIGGRPISRANAMARFVDRTGRAGPATWEGGRFPPGQEEMPVSGVSWYEANAYARWVGKSLPTVFHWHQAAMMLMGAHFIPGSNMEAEGPVSAKSRLGMSPFGLFNMAGNVREWCANATGTQRFILGGGWPDHRYMLMDAFAQDPFDRKVANGIRLVRYPRDEANLALAMRPLERKGRDFSTEVPVSAEEFENIRRLYDYDRTPLNPKVDSRDSTEDWVREKVTIDAAYGGERLPVYVYLPRNARKPYQSVMFFPGSGAFVIKNGLANIGAAEHLIRSGRALIYPIYKSTHERQDTWVDGTSHQSVLYRDEMTMWVKDFRRSVDYLVTRSDMDTARVAYFGVSWGGHMGGILPALEPRLKTTILYVVGFPVERGRPEVELLNFLPRVTIPVLMLNGRFDPYFPVETSQKPFFERLGTPAQDKRHFIAEGGHFVPREQMVAESLNWLDKYLGRTVK